MSIGENKIIRWDESKNIWLLEKRKVNFDMILSEGKFIKDVLHPKRKHQRMLVYSFHGYPYCIPYVQDTDHIFFKTLFPARKFKKDI